MLHSINNANLNQEAAIQALVSMPMPNPRTPFMQIAQTVPTVPEKENTTTEYSSSIPHQFLTGSLNDHRRFLYLFLRQRPVAGLYRIADGREECLVVAGPELWTEDNVFELRPVRNLSDISDRITQKNKEN